MSHDHGPRRLIQLRGDTAANWVIDNPILRERETGWTVDPPRRVKIGDGVTAWNDLPWAADEAASVDALTLIVDDLVARAGVAVSGDGSYDLPAPTGVGFEWLFTGDDLDGPYMNGVAL